MTPGPVQDTLSATVPISIVNGFLSGADHSAVSRLAQRSGIPHGLLRKPDARVTHEQFSTLYRLLAIEFDDEMPGIFSRPLRSGSLKFLCLNLLDAPRLEVALHRFCQFFHLMLDDFRLSSICEGKLGYLELTAPRQGSNVTPLTLCRKLAAEGTTFQSIKDEARRDIAVQTLTQTDTSIAEIANAIGFDNPTAFHRAFRQWTASTPGAYRHRS